MKDSKRPTYLAGGIDAQLKVGEVVEGVKDAEDIHARLVGQLAELEDQIVRVGGVAHGCGGNQSARQQPTTAHPQTR